MLRENFELKIQIYLLVAGENIIKVDDSFGNIAWIWEKLTK
jgi:hypothetical protein